DPHGQVYLHDTSGTRGLDKLDQREALDQEEDVDRREALDQRGALDQRVGDRPYTAIAAWYEWAPLVWDGDAA
ncbi:MAG: hypothetical protein KAG80_11510, partial [Nocardioides sp.]|nr:hypothetical protein [Nocardioides sp.]